MIFFFSIFQICEHLKLCPPSTNEIPEETEVNAGRPYCTLCEYAIGEVDKLIEDKQNEEEIKNVLDRICYELSIPIRKQCLAMVNQYTDEIIQLFVAEYTPQQVCAEIRLCDPAVEEHHAVNNDLIMTNDIPPMDNELDEVRKQTILFFT